MQNMKRGLAAALTVTMVMGSSLTAFAADETSGSTVGAGTSEGHVDTHVINVILPTIEEGSTPFAYTMDAERLIQETNNAKYGDATFPAAASDTGVYFLTGSGQTTTTYTKLASMPEDYDEGVNTAFASLPDSPDQDTYDALNDDEKTCYEVSTTTGGATYANESEALKVTSKSSADVKLTVEVTADSKDTDIALVDEAPGADVTDPQLYLGLKVGSTTTPIKEGETVKAEVTIQGKDDNFQTIVENGQYVYAEKKDAQGNTDPALTWNEETISLTGAVSKASAEDLTAPELTVTWKYEDPAVAQTPAGPTLSAATVSAAARTVTINNGTLDTVTLIKVDGSSVVLNDPKHYSASDNTITFVENVLNNNAGGSIEIAFKEGGKATLTIPAN